MELFSALVEERGITVVLITHEADVAAYASRTLLMRDGRIVEDSAGPRLREVALERPDQNENDTTESTEPAAPERESTEVSG